MCGIAGYFNTSGEWGQKELSVMAFNMSHRGPDAEGFFYEDAVGFAHRRLSIIDLSSHANQPMMSSDERFIIAFNGEIYNYQDIRKKIKEKDPAFSFKTNSDTETILEAYRIWGHNFLPYLNGMFAIAIYDRYTKSLSLYRDRIGIKPLFYTLHNNKLLFASESKALFPLLKQKTLNENALSDYLFLEYIPGTQSILKEVHKLPAGSYLTINETECKTGVYYDLTEKSISTHDGNLSQICDEFESELQRALKYQMISDVPLGAFLSGGTDSSLICSEMTQVSSAPVHTFTIGFNVPEFDESSYANQVAETLKTNHTLKKVADNLAVDLSEKLCQYYDQPFAVPSCAPSLLVCREARHMVTVALSGDGGDELFMGYGYYNWYNRLQKINRMGGKLARTSASVLLSLGNNRQKRVSRIFDYPEEVNSWLHVWSQEQYMFSEKEISKLLRSKYRHQTLTHEWKKIDELKIHPWEKISLFDLKNYLADNLLYKMDIASMASSLEVRVPYLDHNLVEYALKLPIKYKISSSGEQKFLMKKVLEKYLPYHLVYRKKWGFPAPIESWLLNELKHLPLELLNDEAIKKQGIFDPTQVKNLLNEFNRGAYFHYKRIWALIVFQLWYKQYLNN